MPNIYLYAEILTHIRQLTLHASLQTEKYEGAKLEVTTDKKVISVTHDGETQRLYLPTQIKGDATVTFPLLKATDISARVQIEDEHEWKCMINNEIESPWLAPYLTDTTAIRCRNCTARILIAGQVKQWKDLPSENWAEMMEVWFCHKPHDDEHNDDSVTAAAADKGFSLRSRLAVEKGTGMTDLVSIVLCAQDCENIKASERRTSPDTTVLRCEKCLEMLGVTDQDEELVRLQKSSVAVSIADSKWQTYPATSFICAQILSLIESTAVKKFVVHSTATENELTGEHQDAAPLIIWAFNPDIYYSCSAYSGNGKLSESGPNCNGLDVQVPTEDKGNTVDQSESQNTSDAGNDTEVSTGDPGDGPADNQDPSSTAVNADEHINLVHRAAKIFYMDLPESMSATTFLDAPANATSHEELYLHNPTDLIALRSTLHKSTSILPASARTFQNWQIGLLDRYEREPSGLGVMAENPLARGVQAKDGRVTRWDIGHGAEGLYA